MFIVTPFEEIGGPHFPKVTHNHTGNLIFTGRTKFLLSVAFFGNKLLVIFINVVEVMGEQGCLLFGITFFWCDCE